MYVDLHRPSLGIGNPKYYAVGINRYWCVFQTRRIRDAAFRSMTGWWRHVQGVSLKTSPVFVVLRFSNVRSPESLCLVTFLEKENTMNFKITFLILPALLLAACSTTIPVAAIGEDGRILSGVNTFGLGEGSFSVTDGKLTCTGTYNSLQTSKTISMPVVCSDGRKGLIRSTRDTTTSVRGHLG